MYGTPTGDSGVWELQYGLRMCLDPLDVNGGSAWNAWVVINDEGTGVEHIWLQEAFRCMSARQVQEPGIKVHWGVSCCMQSAPPNRAAMGFHKV